ncbi:MCP four helix bundle domain-containing protein, partial [bacterium]|nr:MCP four helix bundle domain-containing protein [bacterium]
MNLKNFSIGNQLFMGFSAIIAAILLLSLVSYNQGVTLHQQTDNLYNHPFAVRRAIAKVEIGVTKMRLATRDLMLASNSDEQNKAIVDGLKSEQNVEQNFKEIYKAYLGPKADIDNAYDAFKVWNGARQKNIKFTL